MVYTKSDILRFRDENGHILTYGIMDIHRDELKDFMVIECNTLKEVNEFIRNQNKAFKFLCNDGMILKEASSNKAIAYIKASNRLKDWIIKGLIPSHIKIIKTIEGKKLISNNQHNIL